VAISGNTIVVGAYRQDSNMTDAGAVYVYMGAGSNWVQQAELTDKDFNVNPFYTDSWPNDFFGNSVAIDGDTLVVGAYGHDYIFNTMGGLAFVYQRSGTAWMPTDVLRPVQRNDGDAWFGQSVAIKGNRIVVGAPRDYVNPAGLTGAALIYNRTTSGWVYAASLAAPDLQSDDFFGQSVAIDGDVVVVGADRQDGSNTLRDSGAVYVFENRAGSWSFTKEFEDPRRQAFDQFGHVVAIQGDTIVAESMAGTAAVNAYVYRRRASGWIREVAVIPSAGAGYYSIGSIALDANDLLFGGRDANAGRAVYSFAIELPPAPVLAGDYNHNGVVDAADYTLWRDRLGSAVTPYTSADGDGNGIVDAADYEVWKANFGRTLPAGAAAGEAVGSGELGVASVVAEGEAMSAEPVQVADSSVQQAIPSQAELRATGANLATDSMIDAPLPALRALGVPRVTNGSLRDDALLIWLGERAGSTEQGAWSRDIERKSEGGVGKADEGAREDCKEDLSPAVDDVFARLAVL
jgi:hypothetical protein